MSDDIAAFIAANPARPGFSAAEMIATWDQLASLADVQSIAADDRATQVTLGLEAQHRRELAAAVRWVRTYHGSAAADAFVTHLGNAGSARAE